jgi:drug/metabolite transporter (DMT)-like permease
MELILVPMLEPILCPVWVFLLLNERPGRWGFYGAVVVITSVIAWSVLKAREEVTRVPAKTF